MLEVLWDKFPYRVQWFLKGIFNIFTDQAQSLSVILILFILSTAFLTIGFYRGTIDPETSDFLLRLFEVLGTLLLVFVYLLMILRDRRERVEEKEAVIMRDYISEVIQPSIELLFENKSQITSIDTNWVTKRHNLEFNNLSISLDSDPRELNRFIYRHPELHEKMREHDDLLKKMFSKANEIRIETEEPLSEYIEQNEIATETGAPPSIDQILNKVLQGVILPDPNDPISRAILEHHEDITQLINEASEGRLDEFSELRKDYEKILEEVLEELQEIRDEIRREYGVSISEVS